MRIIFTPRSLRALLLVLLLVACLPVILLLAGTYQRWLVSRFQEEAATSLEVARAAAAMVETHLRDLAREEGAVGKALVSLHHGSSQQAADYLAASAVEYPSIRALHWIDVTGRVAASSNPDAVGDYVHDQDYFQKALAAHGHIVSDLVRSDLHGGLAFVVARCIRTPRGDPLGIVAASTDLQGLGDGALSFGRLERGIISIVDRQRNPVCTYPPETSVPHNIAPDDPLFAAAQTGNEASNTIRLADGQDWVMARVPIGDFGWVASAGRAEAEVLAPVWRDARRTGPVLLIVLILATMVGGWINHRINVGIRGLCAHAKALARQEWARHVDVQGITEFQELVDAFRHMSGQLQLAQERTQRSLAQVEALNQTLEQRVTERTAVAEHRANQLRTLASELTQAEERERRRLAQILHDNLQQSLVAVSFALATLRGNLSDRSCDPVLQEASDLVQESIRTSRSLTVELSCSVLYDQGLVAALNWLARQMQSRYGFKVAVHAEETTDRDREATRILLFQAVRELLFNAVKHARTDRAMVEVSRPRSGQVQVVVADAGVGFDPADQHASGRSATGLGLFGIKERLEQMGGRMDIESAPGKGTRITMVAPTHSSATTVL